MTTPVAIFKRLGWEIMRSDLLAAIDLGANSFHLSIMANTAHGLRSVMTSRDILHFNQGIDRQGQLRASTQFRALKCLDRFRALLDQHAPQTVRAVGTSSFRQLGVSHAFLPIAEKHLGCAIEVLSGEAEAQLIYQGATWELPAKERMVIDIGGGSTELAMGTGPTPHSAISLPIGSAQLSEQYFNSDTIRREDMAAARQRVRHELAQIPWQPQQWSQVEEALGTSGTVKAISLVLEHLKLSQSGIELSALRRLEPVFWQVSNRTQLSQILELNGPRTRVFPGGYAILLELFEWFQLPKLEEAQRALREGIIVNLMQAA